MLTLGSKYLIDNLLGHFVVFWLMRALQSPGNQIRSLGSRTLVRQIAKNDRLINKSPNEFEYVNIINQNLINEIGHLIFGFRVV